VNYFDLTKIKKMKYTKTLLLLGALLLTVSCKKDTAAATAATGTSGGTTSNERDVFSSMLDSSYVFSWDNRNGNMSGASYTTYLGTSSGDVCTCTATFSGNQSVGQYSVASCTKTTTMTAFDCTTWHTGAGANFTNANGVLTIKKTTNGTPTIWNH
jgi:hypothetical protein